MTAYTALLFPDVATLTRTHTGACTCTYTHSRGVKSVHWSDIHTLNGVFSIDECVCVCTTVCPTDRRLTYFLQSATNSQIHIFKKVNTTGFVVIMFLLPRVFYRDSVNSDIKKV